MPDPNKPRPSRLDDALEREIADALGDYSLDDLMAIESGAALPRPAHGADERGEGRPGRGRRGDDAPRRTRTGLIVMIRDPDVLVEFSPKEQGVCPLAAFKDLPKVGDRVEFVIEAMIEDENLFQLGLPGGATKATWDSIEQGMIVEAMVTGKNTGGLELKVAGHRAFMPVSHVDLGRVEDLAPYVDTKLRCQVIELDKTRNRIVLSRRAVMEIEKQENQEKLFAELQIGEERDGVVRKIEKFGAFVELAPGVDGLIHVSDMSWSRVENPSDILTIGQQVRVSVLSVDRESGRIGLGLKQVQADPWRDVDMKYPVGSQVSGVVKRVVDFGAFVEVEPGVEGLIHVSQLSDQRVRRIESVIRKGQEVTVQVTEADPVRRRLALSLKAMAGANNAASPDEASAGDVRRYVKNKDEARAMQSLMDKFGDKGGLKGGIG